MKPVRRNNRRSSHSALAELQITPLLDLVFVLLVVFIITTPQLTNSLEMNLPSTKAAPSSDPKPKANNVVIGAHGTIQLNDVEVTLEKLKQILAPMRAADPNVAIIVHGAGEADYERVVEVLDLFQQLDISKVGLATETVSEKAVAF